jgi:hypothetical protein
VTCVSDVSDVSNVSDVCDGTVPYGKGTDTAHIERHFSSPLMHVVHSARGVEPVKGNAYEKGTDTAHIERYFSSAVLGVPEGPFGLRCRQQVGALLKEPRPRLRS